MLPGPLLRSAARSGDVKLYEQLFEAAKREKDPRDKRTMIEGLAGVSKCGFDADGIFRI